MERQEIILTGKFKNFTTNKHFYVDNANEQEIAAILVSLSNSIEPYIYEFSGIDTEKINSLVEVEPGLKSVGRFLKSFKKDELLAGAKNKNTMMPIAESYLLNHLLKKALVAFKPKILSAIEPEVEIIDIDKNIVFIGNCKGWFSAKKLSVDEKTQDWEIAAILAGINNKLVNKSFDFDGLKTEVSAQGRKSFGNLATAFETIDETNPYVVCKTCENFGYRPYASPEMLMSEYPDVKPPKIKGRKPK